MIFFSDNYHEAACVVCIAAHRERLYKSFTSTFCALE